MDKEKFKMKKIQKYFLITLFIFINILSANASNLNIDEAIELQYSDPKSAINLLLDNNEYLELMNNDDFLTHQLLLFRLYQKTENNELATQTFQTVNERLSDIDAFKPWIKVLKTSLLLVEQKHSEAEAILQTIPLDVVTTKSDVFKMWFYYTASALEVRQNLYKSALGKINKANNLAIDLNDKYIQMKVLLQLLIIDYYQLHPKKALKKGNELQDFALSLNDEFMEIEALSSIVNIYNMIIIDQGKLINSSDDEEEKQRLTKIRNDYLIEVSSLLDKTLIKSRKAGARKAELRALISLQARYLEDKTYEKVIAVGQETIALSKGASQLYEKAVAYNNISIAYRLLEKYDQSIVALQAAESIYREIDSEQSLLWAYEDYSLTYEASGNYELALLYYKTLHQETLALQRKTNNKEVLELQETFQNEKNINEIEKLNQQNQLNIAQLEADKFQKGIFMAFGLVLIFVVIFIYRDRRVISAKNELLDDLNLKLKEQVIKDPLTGLYNRRLLTEIKDKLLTPVTQINQNECLKHDIGLVILDLDFFKSINDSLGHDVGDAVIQQVSKDLLESVKDDDYVIRWGGEEFLIILMNTTKEEVNEYCQKIMKQSNNNSMNVLSHRLNVTFSIGFASFPFVTDKPHWLSWDDSLKLIDNSLYIAKQQGRNQAVSLSIGNESATDEHKEILLESLFNEAHEIPETIKLTVIKG